MMHQLTMMNGLKWAMPVRLHWISKSPYSLMASTTRWSKNMWRRPYVCLSSIRTASSLMLVSKGHSCSILMAGRTLSKCKLRRLQPKRTFYLYNHMYGDLVNHLLFDKCAGLNGVFSLAERIVRPKVALWWNCLIKRRVVGHG